MKYTIGCLDGKNIDIDGVKVDCGELAKVWDMVRDSLWDQIEDGVRKRAEAEKEAEAEAEANEEDGADEVEEFTANDAHKLAHEFAQAKVNKGLLNECLYKIKDEASKGKFKTELSVDGVAFNFVRYELVRLGYTVSSGEIDDVNVNIMNFTVSW